MCKNIKFLMYVPLFALLSVGCNNEDEFDAEPVQIHEVSVDGITSRTAVVYARITGDVSEMGVCYAEGADPTIESSKVTVQDKDFACMLENLETETGYRLKVFAVSGKEVIYSEALSFNTAASAVPSITTVQISAITPHGATFKALVSADDDVEITERGFCLSDGAGEPTVDGLKLVCEGAGTGPVSCAAAGLGTGVSYKVRGYVAYAGNKVVYGNTVEFSTAAVLKLHRLYYASSHRVFAEAELCLEAWEEGSSWTEMGLCWSTNENPTIDGLSNGYKPLVGKYDNMLAFGLAPETTYYVRAYVTDGTDIYYSDQLQCKTMYAFFGRNAQFTNELLPYDDEVGWIYNHLYYSPTTPAGYDDGWGFAEANQTGWQTALYDGLYGGIYKYGSRELKTAGFSFIKDSDDGDVMSLRLTYANSTGSNFTAYFCFHVTVDVNGMLTVTDFTYDNTNNNPKNLYSNLNSNGDIGQLMAYVEYLQRAPFFVDYILAGLGEETGDVGVMLMSTEAESDGEYFSLTGTRGQVTSSLIQPW